MKTLVIDTIDRLYPLCSHDVCQKEGIEHPSDADWGRGWAQIRKEWERVFNKLNMMDCATLFVAHSTEKKIVKKHTEIDRTQPDLPKGGLQMLHDLSDLILYMGHDKDDNPKLYGRTREGLMVGCRGGIDIDNMEPTFENIAKAIQDATGQSFDEVKPTILLFGPPKVGKSTLASTFPHPIVVDMEKGYKFLKMENKPHICGSWSQFLDICAALHGENGNKEKESNDGPG